MDVAEPYSPDDTIAIHVDNIWQNELRLRGDRLTDGRIFSLLSFTSEQITISPTSYRYVIARRRSPELVEAGLTTRPVAVTGIIHSIDGIVLGRRGSLVAADQGLWEPIPAGGLSRPEPVGQLLDELLDEVGLTPTDISAIEACGLVEDPDSGTFDILYRMQTSLSGDDVRRRFEALSNREHTEIAIISAENMPSFLHEHRESLLPALAPMLRLAGVIGS